jgi:DNA-binding transcriptional MocR family regulator
VLLEMLDDAPTIQAVTMARVEYARRRQLVAAVLESRNISVTGTDGINMWMGVADERSALVTLAAQGVGAAPGEPFHVRRDTPHLRVTVGLIEHDHERVANQLAEAAGGSRSPRGHR